MADFNMSGPSSYISFLTLNAFSRFNAYVISFIPSDNPKHAFTERLAGVKLGKPGDKLKILSNDKTFRFELNLGRNKEQKERIETIYQHLILLGVKSTN